MTENTNVTAEPTEGATPETFKAEPSEQSEQVVNVFADLLAKTGLPPQALSPIEAKLIEALTLTVQNNRDVAALNAAKANDPSKPGYEDELDKLWRNNAATDPAIAPIAELFASIAEEYEAKLKQLRELAKKHIPEQLSEEKAKEVRAQVNANRETIEKAREGAANMATIVDQMLSLNAPNDLPEGGIISLLPEIDSLRSAGKGRKAASAGGIPPYMTRVSEVLIDGKSTNRNGKGKFNFAAEDLSKLFGADIHPDNRVTADELEETYWKAMDKPFRSIKSTELPESFVFDFTKNVKKQNPNDDSFTMAPETVKLTVRQERPVAKPTATDEKPVETEAAKADETKPVEAKPEASKPETKTPVATKKATPSKPEAKK